MRLSPVLLALALLTPAVLAAYADLTISIDPAGLVTIDGITNSLELVPGTYDKLTSKAQGYWLLNLTTDQSLDSYIYTITLPPGAVVSYVSGTNVRLLSQGDTVLVRGSGTNAPLNAVVQYTISVTPQTNTSLAWLPLAAVFVVLTLLWFVVRARRIHTKQDLDRTEVGIERPAQAPSYLEGLQPRQRDIISLLRAAGGTLTQRQVEQALKLPKSSVSRNVEALRRRGIIEKAQSGMSNTLVLGEKYH